MEIFGFDIPVPAIALVVGVISAGFGARSMLLARRREKRELAALARREGKLRLGILALLDSAHGLAGRTPEAADLVAVKTDRPSFKAIITHIEKLPMEDIDVELQKTVLDLRIHCLFMAGENPLGLRERRWAYQFVYGALVRLAMRYGATSRDLYSITGDGTPFMREHQGFRDFNKALAERELQGAFDGIESIARWYDKYERANDRNRFDFHPAGDFDSWREWDAMRS